MMEYGLIGERLGHSFSPEIHGAIADYKYELKELPREELAGFFRKKEFCAVNVTIPYKEAVIPLLDEVEDAARDIGAVNTVVNKDGKLYGYNTDCYGMRAAMLREGILPVGKKVLICGAGGTSKTASYVARELGASEVVFLSRNKKDGCETYEDAYVKHTDAGVIINTTPCGMYPDNSSCAVDISKFPELSGVFDAVYNPLRSPLIVAAKCRGIPASGGLFMLVSQAVRASELFRGRVCSKGLAERIYSDILKRKENIVLIGMPSSGKTTVGKLVAKALDREFVDTDDEIERREGASPAELIRKYGEAHFRDSEAAAVREVSKLQGKVIATGGGAVLRRENVDRLLQNGRIYFLNRPLDMLTATGDRPLTSDRESLEKKYRERIDIYNDVCDVKTDSSKTASDAAKSILDDFDLQETL